MRLPCCDMGTESAIYQIVLLLHIAAAIVGFGGVIAHGAYNAKAFAGTAGDAVVLMRTTKAVTSLAHYAIYGVFALGIVLIAVSDKAYEFSEAWVSASFVVWFLIVGAAHGLIRPTVAGLQARAEELPADTNMPDDEQVLGFAKKLALGEGVTQLLLVIALVLMIWKPGA